MTHLNGFVKTLGLIKLVSILRGGSEIALTSKEERDQFRISKESAQAFQV